MGRVVNAEELGHLVRRKRREKGLTLRQAAEECGVSAATLSRIEKKIDITPDTETLTALARWLGVPIERFLIEEVPRPVHSIVHGKAETTLEVIEAHLRADPTLAPQTVEALMELVKVAYKQFSRPRQAASSSHTESRGYGKKGVRQLG